MIFSLRKINDFYNFCPKAWGVRSTVPVIPSTSSGPVLVEIENLPRSSGMDQHDRKWFVNFLNQIIACLIISKLYAIILEYFKHG